MKELNFRVRVITPLFMSGADQKTVEMRPPSIRGALRFWFRAMMGGLLKGDWQKVRQLEASIFGSPEQGSSWQVKVGENTLQTLRAHDAVGPLDEGILYLGFNLFRRGRRPRGKPPEPDTLERGCFWPSEKEENFSLQVAFCSNNLIVQQVVLGTLWLLIHCGGLGARVRRGFGALDILEHRGNDLVDLAWGWPQQGSKDFFHTQLNRIAGVYAQFAKLCGITADPKDIFNRTAMVPSFSCFVRWQGLIFRPAMDKGWQKWTEALGVLGRELRNFRRDPTSQSQFGATGDYKVVAPFLDGELSSNSVADLRYDGFGLPIQYRSATRTGNVQEQARREALREGLSEQQANERARRLQVRAILQAERQVGDRWERIDRRASPLIMRPIRFQDGSYGNLLLFFNAEFLPPKTRELLKPISEGWPSSYRRMPDPVPVQTADLQVVSDFLNSLKQNQNYEVEEL